MENYFQLCLSGTTDVCNVFHLLFIISFHILSSFTLKKCYLADVSVCFWLLWGGFKRLFLLFASLLKENPLGFYKASVSHGLTGQATQMENTVCSPVLWYLKNKDFYKLLWYRKVFYDMYLNWFCITWITFVHLKHLSWPLPHFFSLLFISLYFSLLVVPYVAFRNWNQMVRHILKVNVVVVGIC